VSVTVLTRATGSETVIVMDKLQKTRASKCCLKVSLGIVTRGEDVAGVKAHAELRCAETLYEVQELLHVREKLRALTRRSLQEKRTLRRRVLQATGNRSTHLVNGLLLAQLDRFADMNDDTLTPKGFTDLEILDEEFLVPRVFRIFVGKIDKILTVDKDTSSCLFHEGQSRRQIFVIGLNIGILRTTEENLIGSRRQCY
jgi:hypothetical protein